MYPIPSTSPNANRFLKLSSPPTIPIAFPFAGLIALMHELSES
jgi:hypothetical protein